MFSDWRPLAITLPGRFGRLMFGRKPDCLPAHSRRLAYIRTKHGPHELHVGPFFALYWSKDAQAHFLDHDNSLPSINDEVTAGMYTRAYLKSVFDDFADYYVFLTTKPLPPHSASPVTVARWFEIASVMSGLAEGRDLLQRFNRELAGA